MFVGFVGLFVCLFWLFFYFLPKLGFCQLSNWCGPEALRPLLSGFQLSTNSSTSKRMDSWFDSTALLEKSPAVVSSPSL